MSADAEDYLVVLFHGTTESRAESIQRQGWKPVSISDEIDRVAKITKHDPRNIEAHLKENKRWVELDRQRDGRTISFTTGLNHAMSYSSRAPEVEWEALWSAYRLGHPEIGECWNHSDEGHWWVLKHQLADRPVIVTVTVPLSEILQIDPNVDPSYFDLGEQFSEEDGVEIGLEPTSSIEIVKTSLIDRRVDRALLSFLAGVSQEDIASQIEDGPRGDSFVYAMERFWNWEDVYRQLSETRRTELGLPNRESWWD